MKALLLEEKGKITLTDVNVSEALGDTDVRIKIKACGICGSDIHYYKEGRIGDFIVKEPMILGHEASGEIIEVGSSVAHLKMGDRVCMEPGIPNFMSAETLEGNYNLDKDVKFWATPPIHGVMRESVVHPSSFVFKLPDNVTYHQGAMIEPLAVGIEAAKQADIEPGDVALVTGSGTIGILVALSALSAGCSKVIISDLSDIKLDIARKYDQIVGVNPTKENLLEVVKKETSNKGVDVFMESSGSDKIFPDIFRCCKPGGRSVLVGMPSAYVQLDIPLIQVLGISIKTVFRYRNCFARALQLIASEKINLDLLVSKVFTFEQSVDAYNFAAAGRPEVIKVMIDF